MKKKSVELLQLLSDFFTVYLSFRSGSKPEYGKVISVCFPVAV